MYKRLTSSSILVGSRILRILGVRYFLNNYFAKRLTHSRMRVELASPARLGYAIIYIIILPCINV